MKRSTKAALLSAFICPGAGHIYLKKYYFGSFLFALAFFIMFVIMSKAVSKAKTISDKIVSGEIPPDMNIIRDLIEKSQTPQEIQLINILTLVFFFTWVIGIIDSYRTARQQEANATFEA